MRTWSLGLAAPLALLTGCGSNTFTDRSARLELPPPPLRDAAVGKDDGGKKVAKVDPEQVIVETFRDPSNAARNGMAPRQYRDSVIWRVIAKDDDSFHIFTRNVRSDRALMNMSADGAAIFLSGLAAVTGTAGEKAALAVLSGGVLSAKGSVDRQLFNQETMTALLTRMRAARLAALVPIKRGLSLSADAYPLEKALVDLREYANAGSLLATIEAITTDAGKVTQKAEEGLLLIDRGVEYLDSRDTVRGLGVRLDKMSAQHVTALLGAIEKLRSAKSDELTAQLVRRDRNGARYKDPEAARKYLRYWLEQESGSVELSQWDQAMSLAEKGQ